MFEDDEDYLQMTSIKTKMITEPSLGHAYDFQNGIASSDKDANGVEYDEYRAVQFENLIRKEEKRPMRTTYGKHPVPQKYLNQQ